VSIVELGFLGFRAQVVGPSELLCTFRALTPLTPQRWTIAPGGSGIGSRAEFRLYPRRHERDTRHVPDQIDHTAPVDIERDGVHLATAQGHHEALAFLLWAIHTAAVEHLGSTYLLFHAGAVARGRFGILLPGPSGTGKTTLVAALVAAGFSYLGDDIAPIDPASLTLLPFSKSLGVKAGARRILTSAYPELLRSVPRLRAGGESVWYLPPPQDSWPSSAASVRCVVFPRYQARARTSLALIGRSDALKQLIEQSFGLGRHGVSGIAAAVNMLQEAECYELTMGSLRASVHVIQELADRDQSS